MDALLEPVAGLDVHKRSVTACVRTPGPGQKWSLIFTCDGRRTREVRRTRRLATVRRIPAVSAGV